MDFDLTQPCPYCSKTILTLTGMVAADTDPTNPAILGVPQYCDCEESAAAERALQVKEAERARAAERDGYLRNLRASGLPRNYGTDGLAAWQYEGDAARSAALKIACAIGASLRSGKHNGRGLYISVGIGTGKTYFAAAMLHDLLMRGIRCKWSNAGNILREIRSSYGKGGEQEDEIMLRYTKINVLAIDDLGKERPTDWALEQLFSLLNTRYEEGRTTIITSNYTLHELAARINPVGAKDSITADAIVDRISATCYPVHLSGNSRRTTLTLPQ